MCYYLCVIPDLLKNDLVTKQACRDYETFFGLSLLSTREYNGLHARELTTARQKASMQEHSICTKFFSTSFISVQAECVKKCKHCLFIGIDQSLGQDQGTETEGGADRDQEDIQVPVGQGPNAVGHDQGHIQSQQDVGQGQGQVQGHAEEKGHGRGHGKSDISEMR